jgi:spermidine synthase
MENGSPMLTLAGIRQTILAGLLAVFLSAFLLVCAPAHSVEKLLLERPSAFNGSVVVTEDEAGLRTLRFGRSGARQSVVKPGDPDHLELVYTRVISTAFLFVERPRTALIVGLGGGTIPSFLRRHFPDLDIDVVDIDPVVVEVAQSHMGFRPDARLRVHVQDGRAFVERAPVRYDLVFLDAYGADSVPYRLATREFLEAVRRGLAPRGAVIGNLWGRASNRLYDAMVRTYAAVFDEVSLLSLASVGNVLVFATPWKTSLTRDEVLVRAAAIGSALSLRVDMVPLIERGLRLREPAAPGSVLRDAAPPVQAPLEGRAL